MPSPAVIMMMAAAGNAGASGPVDFANLWAWYDASDTTSITDSVGAVSQWNDLSGNGRHLTNSGASNTRPTTNFTTINSKNVLIFDGGDILQSASTTWPSGNYSTYCVVAMTNDTGLAHWIWEHGSSAPAGRRWLWWNRSWFASFGLYNGYYDGSTPRDYVRSWTYTSSPQLFDQVADGTNFINAVNGSEASASQTGTPASATNVLYIGKRGDGSMPASMNLAELRIYSTAHDSTTRSAVRSELNAKWGL